MRVTSLLACIAALVPCCLCSVSPASADDQPGAFMTVNGVSLSRDEFVSRLEAAPMVATKGGKKISLPAGRYVAERCLAEILIKQLAEKEGVPVTPAQVNKAKALLTESAYGNLADYLKRQGLNEQEWCRQLEATQAYANLLTKGVKVSNAEIKAEYDRQMDLAQCVFRHPEAVRISVITSESEEKIRKAYDLLRQGAEFSDVARQLSEDKTSLPDGGRVGWLSKDMQAVPKPIRTTAFGLEVGKYCRPFWLSSGSDSGWVIIKAEEKCPAKVDKLEDVSDLIRQGLAVKKADPKRVEKMVREFIEKSAISVHSDLYTDLPELLRANGAVGADLDHVTKPSVASPSEEK